MSLRLLPFSIDHLGLIRLRSSDDEQLDLFKSIYQGNEERFRVWTMVTEDSIPVAICGMTILWPSVANVFMAFSEDVESNSDRAGEVFWGIKRFIKQIFDEYRLHRMEAATSDQSYAQIRWMKLLGFEIEGIMKKYDPQGRDYFRFAKVK